MARQKICNFKGTDDIMETAAESQDDHICQIIADAVDSTGISAPKGNLQIRGDCGAWKCDKMIVH